jgi:hypothetical protein
MRRALYRQLAACALVLCACGWALPRAAVVAQQRPPSRVMAERSHGPVVDEGLFYMAEGRRVGLRRRTDLIAVAPRSAALVNDLLARLARAAGALNGLVAVVRDERLLVLRHADAGRDTTNDGLQRWGARMLAALAEAETDEAVAWAAPVFVDAESGTLQVATDAIVVALRRPVDAVAFFAGDRRFVSHRAVAGTDDQFVVTLTDAAGEAAVHLANALHDDARIAWAAPEFVRPSVR